MDMRIFACSPKGTFLVQNLNFCICGGLHFLVLRRCFALQCLPVTRLGRFFEYQRSFTPSPANTSSPFDVCLARTWGLFISEYSRIGSLNKSRILVCVLPRYSRLRGFDKRILLTPFELWLGLSGKRWA